MAVTRTGFVPTTAPTSALAAATRQYASRIDPGEYGNAVDAVHLVKAGDRITKAGFYVRASTGGTTGNVQMAPYITNAAGTTEGARVGSGWTISTSNATPAYYETVLDIDLSAYVGQYIKVCGGSSGGLHRYNVTCTSGDSVSVDASLPSPFGTVTARTNLMAMYMEVTSAQEISNVNGGGNVVLGAAATWTTGGFSPAVNAATLDGKACSSVSSSGFTPPSLTVGQQTSRLGNRTLTGTNGSQSQSVTVPVAPPSPYAFRQLVSPINTGTYSWVKELSPAAADGEQVVFLTQIGGLPTNTEVDPDGLGRTDFVGTQTLLRIRVDGTVDSFTVTTGDPEPVVVAPVMPNDATVNVSEGATILGTFAASSGTAPISYSVGGAQAALFNIDASTASVAFKSSAAPGSGSITVTGTNSAGSDSQTVSYTVTAVDTAPVMPADTSVTVYEGATFLATASATSGTAPITYTLGGSSAALFDINASTGAVTFKSAAAVGAGSITVSASNAQGSDSQVISFSVLALPEPSTGRSLVRSIQKNLQRSINH